MKMVQLLGLRGPWLSQVCSDMDCLCLRSYGPIRVFFQVSCSWPSEALFGQSFSVALPVQELTGLSGLGSFSVVWHVRHIEGPPLAGVLLCTTHQALKGAPWVGSYSVVQGRQAFNGSASLLFSCQCWRVEGEAMVMTSLPRHDSAVSCLAFMAA